ncbi:membrane dipeptidase [Candidatus Chlorohelix sp.]|uniref:dipeptidase n=1 Tax=Candidatus Chlorohelix sp. TaxID=3139201 RepID=UPI00305D5ECD
MPDIPFIIDSHLDIGWNASFGRDFYEEIKSSRERVNDGAIYGERLVSLPDLLDSPVRLVIGTIFTLPKRAISVVGEGHSFSNAEEAHTQGMWQIDFYNRVAREQPHVNLIRNRIELNAHLKEINEGTQKLGIMISIEGADPIRQPDELQQWVDKGLRLIGPAWKSNRYCGGTGEPGTLTPLGVELLAEMQRLGVILDVSHMAEESFYNALDAYSGVTIASHSNCRHIINTDRQLSDDMIRCLLERDTVIGVVLYDSFLVAKEEGRKATLEDVVRHISHICELAGHTRAIGLGTDWDGGFGAESIPEPLKSLNDLPLVGEELLKHGFNDNDIRNFYHANWLRVFEKGLAQFD